MKIYFRCVENGEYVREFSKKTREDGREEFKITLAVSRKHATNYSNLSFDKEIPIMKNDLNRAFAFEKTFIVEIYADEDKNAH